MRFLGYATGENARRGRSRNNRAGKTLKNLSGEFSYIERNPIIERLKTAAELGLSRNGLTNYIAILCNKDILKYSAKSGKALLFAYEEYPGILRKDT